MSIENDLTQGSVPKQLLTYALPMVSSSLLQAFYSMTDLVISGHFVGSNGISAINNSSQIIMVVTNLAIGITTGGNVIIGQFFGAGEKDGQRKSTGTLFTLSMVIGILFTIAFYLMADPMLRALGAPAFTDASAYLRICSMGIFFTFGYNALSAILRAVGNSKQPFHFIAISTAINIILDLLFVGYFKMGTSGAAIATVTAQAVSFILAFLFVLQKKELFECTVSFLKIHSAQLKMILKVGIPSAIQMSIVGFSWLLITTLINQYGVDISAGNGVSIKIKDFCQLFILAMANSATTMIAQNLGAKKFDRSLEILHTTMGITFCMAIVTILIVELFAPQLVSIFTPDPKVAQAAILNLRIEILAQLLFAIFMVYHGLANAAGHSIFAMISSFSNCVVARLALSIVFNRLWGISGIYIACAIAPIPSVILGMLYTKSNIWRKSLAGKQNAESI